MEEVKEPSSPQISRVNIVLHCDAGELQIIGNASQVTVNKHLQRRSLPYSASS